MKKIYVVIKGGILDEYIEYNRACFLNRKDAEAVLLALKRDADDELDYFRIEEVSLFESIDEVRNRGGID